MFRVSYTATMGTAASPNRLIVAFMHLAFDGALHTASSADWQAVGTGAVGALRGRHPPPLLELKQKLKQSTAVVGCAAHSLALLRPPGRAAAGVRLKSTFRVALARQEKDDQVVLPQHH